jgi:NAD(P)-dependent dehydrogenase (short-subunit alcohol dehydrogenase family)
MSRPLSGQVAVVAGATRGAGRGIARMLGEAGATVYCTGRSSRAQPNASGDRHAGRPETIEETAEMVTAAGGAGIAVRVDHTVDAEVGALFDRVWREQQRLDLLATVMTGRPFSWTGFLDERAADGWSFVESWIRPRLATTSRAAQLMTRNESGLIVELVEQDNVGYHGALYFDLMETLLKRFVFALAHELGPQGITAVAVAPGYMRTEAILEGYGVTEDNWRDALSDARAAGMGWGGSETPCFTGRAVAALASDPHVSRKNGGIYTVRALSDEYGFTDITGTRPDFAVLDTAFEQAKTTFLAPMVEAAKHARVDWKATVKTGEGVTA